MSFYAPEDGDSQERLQWKLIAALSTNHGEDDLRELLDRLDDVNALYPHLSFMHNFSEGKVRTRPLFEASKALPQWKDKLVNLLVMQYGSDVNLRNESGETALHGAVSAGNRSAVRALLDHGAYIDIKVTPITENSKATENHHILPGFTALHVAAHCGSEMMCRLLLQRGAITDVVDAHNNTALDIAIQQGHRGPFWAIVEYGSCTSTSTLSKWIFTSDSIERKPEQLVSALESLIRKYSALPDIPLSQKYRSKCQDLEKVDPRNFKAKSHAITKWPENRRFNTPFAKRCLLCRQIIASLGAPVANGDACIPSFSQLSLQENKQEYILREAVLTLYEGTTNHKGHAWKNKISEELSQHRIGSCVHASRILAT